MTGDQAEAPKKKKSCRCSVRRIQNGVRRETDLRNRQGQGRETRNNNGGSSRVQDRRVTETSARQVITRAE